MPKLYTIGHSNHTLDEFISLLQAHDITNLVDIRTVPKSRYVPWFNKDDLSRSLSKININYTHTAQLGGLRHAHKDSINIGWHNPSFRGYADYMQTSEFYAALKQLNKLLKEQDRVAIMCSEAVPWHCHRSLVADAELIRGIKVFHIMNKTQAKPHTLTPFAVVDKSMRPIRVFYP
jgi:uncharacterized protein (DUF488 family)